MSVIGVPIKVIAIFSLLLSMQNNSLKVLHEAEGHIVTIETTSGEVLLYIQDSLDLIHSYIGMKYICRLVRFTAAN